MAGITEALRRIKERIEKAVPASRAVLVSQSDGQEAKLTCQAQNVQIKVEVNTIIRGHVLPPRIMDVSDKHYFALALYRFNH